MRLLNKKQIKVAKDSISFKESERAAFELGEAHKKIKQARDAKDQADKVIADVQAFKEKEVANAQRTISDLRSEVNILTIERKRLLEPIEAIKQEADDLLLQAKQEKQLVEERALELAIQSACINEDKSAIKKQLIDVADLSKKAEETKKDIEQRSEVLSAEEAKFHEKQFLFAQSSYEYQKVLAEKESAISVRESVVASKVEEVEKRETENEKTLRLIASRQAALKAAFEEVKKYGCRKCQA